MVGVIVFAILFLFFTKPLFAGNPPTLSSPADNSSVSSSKLTWEAVSYSLYSNDPYRIQVDDDQTFSSISKDYNTDNTFYTPSLSEGTWYWRVKAKDSNSTWSDWSSIWKFTYSTSSSSPTPSPSSVSSSFAISNLPSTIDSTETFTVKVSLSLLDDPSTSFYLKGAFKKEGSSNYFGLTKVSSSWIKNGSSSSNQYKLTTDSNGSWSGNLEVQPDILDSGYEGSGSYIFKVGRYSSSGSGPTWSNEASITINAKEVSGGEDNGNINLSNISSKSKRSLTSKSEDIADLPEEVYSLENYKKNATIAGATSASPSPNTLIKEERQVNWFFVLGGLLVIAGVGPLVYIFIKSRVKSLD